MPARNLTEDRTIGRAVAAVKKGLELLAVGHRAGNAGAAGRRPTSGAEGVASAAGAPHPEAVEPGRVDLGAAVPGESDERGRVAQL